MHSGTVRVYGEACLNSCSTAVYKCSEARERMWELQNCWSYLRQPADPQQRGIMPPPRSSFIAAATLLLATAAPLTAQPHMQPAGLDLGVAFNTGRGGGFVSARDGVAASAVMAWNAHTLAIGALTLAAAATVRGTVGGSDDCLITPQGDCAHDYPAFQTLSLLGGWAVGTERGSAGMRILLGPAAARSSDGGIGMGLQGRIDAVTPAISRVALLGWVQATNVPRLRGESYRFASVGAGIRIR